MSTLSIKQKQIGKTIADITLKLSDAIQESMYDFIVTFTALIAALIAVFAAADGIAELASWGMFIIISVYLILLVIRILRRLDTSWTVDELGEEIAVLKAILERMERNA